MYAFLLARQLIVSLQPTSNPTKSPSLEPSTSEPTGSPTHEPSVPVRAMKHCSFFFLPTDTWLMKIYFSSAHEQSLGISYAAADCSGVFQYICLLFLYVPSFCFADISSCSADQRANSFSHVLSIEPSVGWILLRRHRPMLRYHHGRMRVLQCRKEARSIPPRAHSAGRVQCR